ncbi:MAG: sugar phosphate isomerase/epimerase [Oscillospiraceae bacterium]|nr:sugar phosphate isomerase/epimerase [Oscillospiraceae bacterium]
MKHGLSMEIVDTHNQQPNRNRRESKYYWDEIYTLVSAGGFTEVETPYDPQWAFGGRSGVPLVYANVLEKDGSAQNYLKRLNGYGIERIVGVHYMPGMFFSGTSPHSNGAVSLDAYFGAMEYFGRGAVDYVADLSGSYVTMSATPKIGEIEKAYGENYESGAEDVLKGTAAAVERLASYARSKGVRFCLKNEFYGLLRGDKIIDFVKALNEKVYLDIDTAEYKISGCCPVRVIREHPDLIGVVHYSDTSFVDDQECYRQMNPEFPAVKASKVYRDLGDGTIHFPKVEAALKDIGFTGHVIVSARDSYDVSRSILRARYYINSKLPE